jgi:iron complex outermembrane receptor protein
MLREHLALARRDGDDVYAAATNQTGQGWRSQSQQNIQFGALNIGRAFGQDREVRFIVNGSNINQEIPGALTLAQFQNDPHQTAAGNANGDQGRNQRGVRGSLGTTWRLDDNLVFQGAVYAVWKDLDHPIFQVIDQQSRNYGAFGRFDWDGELGGKRADAFFGAWYRTGDMDSNFYANLRGPRRADLAHPAERRRGRPVRRGPPVRHRQPGRGGRRDLGPGRARLHQLRRAGRRDDFRPDPSRDLRLGSPRASACCGRTKPDNQVFANITRSVEPPNFGSMRRTPPASRPVSAQEAWTGEVGARGHAGPVHLRRGPVPRPAEERDAAVRGRPPRFRPSPSTPTRRCTRGSRRAGLGIGPAWRLRQTWTYSDFRFDGDAVYGDNRLPIVPKNFYRAEVRYDDPRGWFVAPSIEWSATDVLDRLRQHQKGAGLRDPEPERRLRSPTRSRCSSTRGTWPTRPMCPTPRPRSSGRPPRPRSGRAMGRSVFGGVTVNF